MSSAINLSEHFGWDFYSIGLFQSALLTRTKQKSDSIDEIYCQCFKIKDEYNSMNSIFIRNEILTFFYSSDDIDHLITGYVPYKKDKPCDILLGIDDYATYSKRMMELAVKVSNDDPDLRNVLVELFNLVDSYSLDQMNKSLDLMKNSLGKF